MYIEGDEKDFVCPKMGCCCINCNFLTIRVNIKNYETTGRDAFGMPKTTFKGFEKFDYNISSDTRKDIVRATLSLNDINVLGMAESFCAPELRCYRSIWNLNLYHDLKNQSAVLTASAYSSEILKETREKCEFFIPYRHGCTADGAIEIEKRRYEHQKNVINQIQTDKSLELTRTSNRRTFLVLMLNICISIAAICISIWAVNSDKEGDINNTLQTMLKHYQKANPGKLSDEKSQTLVPAKALENTLKVPNNPKWTLIKDKD